MEVLRSQALLEEIQQNHRIPIAGPTTDGPAYQSTHGIRTLAIEKQASEVWQVLAAAKTEFEKFRRVGEGQTAARYC